MKLSLISNSLPLLIGGALAVGSFAAETDHLRGLGNLATKIFRIELSSANLTPPFIQEPVGAGGDAKVKFRATGSGVYKVCMDVTVDGFTPAIVHLHKGEADGIGPVVVGFGSVLDGNTVKGCVPINEEDYIAALANPEGYYINMHAGPSSERDDPNADYYRGARAQLA